MATFTTDLLIKNRLAGLLKQLNLEDGLSEYWDDIVTDSRTSAYNEIVSRLADRGLSLTQIADWERGAEFERDIALYWCLIKGAVGGEDDKFIKQLDRRKELDEVAVVIDGEVVTGGGNDGPVGYGVVSADVVEFNRVVTSGKVTNRPRW